MPRTRLANRLVPRAIGAVTGALVWLVMLTQACTTDSAPQHATVRIDSMSVAGITNGLKILMYADGAATVDFGGGTPRSLVDTIRFSSAPSYTLDVSDGAVHVEMVEGMGLGGGVISLSGVVNGVTGSRLRAVGRHLVVEKGGRGIRVVDRGNANLMQ